MPRNARNALPAKQPNVRASRSGRPIMALLDLLGRRWALRVVWELRDDQALTSRALRTACDEASPTILQTRLSELRDAGLVELTSDGYRLTEIGKELFKTFLPLHRFAERWSKLFFELVVSVEASMPARR